MAQSEYQKRWRAKQRGQGTTGVTVYLDSDTLAGLDVVAQRLVQADPHDPPHHLSETVGAGRAQAIRWLVAQWVQDHPETRLEIHAAKATPNAIRAGYWRRMTNFRRWRPVSAEQAHNTPRECPEPPWWGPWSRQEAAEQELPSPEETGGSGKKGPGL